MTHDAKPPAPDAPVSDAQPKPVADSQQPKETGGPKGLEPTRYGDWEQNGRCTDF